MKRLRAFNVALARLLGLSVATVALFLVGCMNQRAFTTPDSWFDPPPSRQTVEQGSNGQQLDPTRIYPVTDSSEARAEAILDNVPFVEITPRQAEDFVGRRLYRIPSAGNYLVRALYLNWGTGRFCVDPLPEDDIVVCHACLGHHPASMKRHAIVLQLDKPPRDVFVTCEMAE